MLTARRFCLGNVADTSPSEALASERLAALVRLCERRKEEIETCRGCAWRHFCQASCPASIRAETGTWHATDGLCDLRRELYRERIMGRALADGGGCGL